MRDDFSHGQMIIDGEFSRWIGSNHKTNERQMKVISGFMLKVLGWILMIPVYFYKYAISPLTSPSCRHDPTCSQYAIDAIKIHGPFKGFWLGTKRIAKCHPWGTHGYDPVPPKKEKIRKPMK